MKRQVQRAANFLLFALLLSQSVIALADEVQLQQSLAEIFKTAPLPFTAVSTDSAARTGSNMSAHPQAYLYGGKDNVTWLGNVGDAELLLFGQQKKLRLVTMRNAAVTDRGVSDLAASGALQHVEISTNQTLTNAALEGWENCRELTVLQIGPVQWSDKACKLLAAAPKLERLTIYGGTISGGGVAELTASKSLWLLKLSGVDVQDAKLDRLTSTRLSYVEVSGCQLRPGDVAALAKFTSILSLNVSNTNFNDQDLLQLQGLEQLEHLSLAGTNVTFAGLQALKKLPKLQSLSFDGPPKTDWQIAEAEQQRLANAYGWTFGGACSCGCLDICPQPKTR